MIKCTNWCARTPYSTIQAQNDHIKRLHLQYGVKIYRMKARAAQVEWRLWELEHKHRDPSWELKASLGGGR